MQADKAEMWQRFRSWPLWIQIVAWCLFAGLLWLVWLWQKRSWPVWVRIGLAVTPVVLWFALGTLLSSPAPPAADAQAKAKETTKASPHAVPVKKPAKRKSKPTAHPEKVKTVASESEVTGFGATTAAWNAHHVADDRFDPGAAYDPDPSLARGGDERFDDRYSGVDHTGGTVENYEMRFPPSTGVQEATQFVLASEFPPDAKVVWFRRLGTCAQMFVYSKTVDPSGDVGALVEFSSGEAGDNYNPRDVWYALVVGLPLSGPKEGPDC